MLPTRDTVIQEGDLLHLVMREETAAEAYQVINARPGRRADMRVAIAGAGAVGRSIARELITNGHQVLLIDKDPASIKPERVPDAEWLLADSCELSSLEEARLDQCDVVIAATGDDKANLVTSLLAKTEFGVPRTVGRVNHPNNEWLFTEAWGVDVNVSTPRIMSALVEEAVTVGDLVRLFTFRQGNANLVELTLPADSPYVGKPSGLIPFPENVALVTILRDGQVYAARRRAADRGRRRAAVRRRGRRGVSSRSCSAPTGTGSSRLDRGVVAPQQPRHRRERRQLQGPAHRDLEHAERWRRRCRPTGCRSAPASQIGPCTSARTAHGSTSSQVSRRAQPHHLAVRVPGGRVAGDAADHEADERPAEQAGEPDDRRRSRCCRGVPGRK